MDRTRHEPRPPRPAAALAAGLGLLGSAFVVAWWTIGDLSYDEEVDGGLDHLFEAPAVPGWVTVTAALAGVVVGVAMLRVLMTEPAIRKPALALGFVGMAAAFGGRVMTAGVIGANIGGGMFMIFALPVLTVVALTSLALIGRRTARPR